MNELLFEEGFGKVLPGNLGHSENGTILIRNLGWRCGRTIFDTTTRSNLKVRNSPYGTERFMNGGGLPVFMLNDWLWNSLQFVIPLKKFTGNGLRRRIFERACFVRIRSLNEQL